MSSIIASVKKALRSNRSSTDEVAAFEQKVETWNPANAWTFKADLSNESLARAASNTAFDPEGKKVPLNDAAYARTIVADFTLQLKGTREYPSSEPDGTNFRLNGVLAEYYEQDPKLGTNHPMSQKVWFAKWVLDALKEKLTTQKSSTTLPTINPAAAASGVPEAVHSPASADLRKTSDERVEEARARNDSVIGKWSVGASSSIPAATPEEAAAMAAATSVTFHTSPSPSPEPSTTAIPMPLSAKPAPPSPSPATGKKSPSTAPPSSEPKPAKTSERQRPGSKALKDTASARSKQQDTKANQKSASDISKQAEQKEKEAKSRDAESSSKVPAYKSKANYGDDQWNAVAAEMSVLGVDSEDMVNLMTSNLNGTTIASDGEAAAGYVDYVDKFHVFVEHTHDIPLFAPDDQENAPIPGTEENGTKLPASFMMNWVLNCFMKAKGDAKAITDKILVQQYIKVLVMYSGVYAPSKAARKVYSDEYEYHSVADVKLNAAILAVLALKKDPKVEAKIKVAGSNILRIVGTVVHMFRTRNHHYQDSAIDFLDRTYSAAWNGSPDMLGLNHLELFRESIHCAGMYPLVLLIDRARDRNVLPAALVIRQSAARAGTAPVRVAAAAFRTMKAEPFYKMVEKHYKEEIANLMDHDEELQVIGDYAHINHYFFAGVKDRGDYNENVILPVVALAVGYINSLGRGASLRKQQTLVKRVANYDAIVSAYKDAIIKWREDNLEDNDLESILASFKASA